MNLWARLKFVLIPKRCRKCGRLLYTEESRKLGLGPECAKGSQAEREMEALRKSGQMQLFDEGEIKK